MRLSAMTESKVALLEDPVAVTVGQVLLTVPGVFHFQTRIR